MVGNGPTLGLCASRDTVFNPMMHSVNRVGVLLEACCLRRVSVLIQ